MVYVVVHCGSARACTEQVQCDYQNSHSHTVSATVLLSSMFVLLAVSMSLLSLLPTSTEVNLFFCPDGDSD